MKPFSVPLAQRTPPLLLCALALLCGCATTRTPSAPSSKERCAEDLLALVPPEVMFSQLAQPFAQGYTRPHSQQQAHTSFIRNLDTAELNRILREALLKHFTEPELKALLAFYSTPEGRACLAKTAPFAADVVPACAQEAAKAFRRTGVDAATGRLFP
jgi:hypothetical protein